MSNLVKDQSIKANLVPEDSNMLEVTCGANSGI